MTHSIMPGALTHKVHITAAGVSLCPNLEVPPGARGVVIMAQVGGAERSNEAAIVDALEASGFGTLVVDLLTPAEVTVDLQTAQLRSDVELLTSRLLATVQWLSTQAACAGLPIGVHASGAAAAAALEVAAMRVELVHAIVSRGGRPDRADEVLWNVHAPTLLIVGRRDLLAVARNRYALERMICARKLVLLEGVGHAFEGGAPEEAARLATEWFSQHMTVKPPVLAGAAAGSEMDDVC